MIDRCFPAFQELNGKILCLIATAADPQHEAAAETLADFRGFLRCIPNAVEAGVIYGTGAWDKGDIYKNPALAQACEMGKQIL